MKLANILFAIVAVAVLAGCSDSTAVSKEPTAAEIEKGKQNRLAEIDKLNIPEPAKQRMRDQVNGQSPAATPGR